jgi:hypothetical protein
MFQQAIFTLAGQRQQVAVNPLQVNAVLSDGGDDESGTCTIFPGVRDQLYGVQFVVEGTFPSVIEKLDATSKSGV